ncbi:PolC-type DNA polymerase III [Aestuariivivens sediminis]|uniref:3'-5' exonuclease n=1 Tax=Aestuariivivens sediminis TaxID=2913557 RepID=UPI001F56D667|nr:3'-5' exonuclease [Aestuariivivens sediminis]
MGFNWFKKKYKDTHPQFWKDYVDRFDSISKAAISDTRFIAFDTETTGFNKIKDRILSIGAVSIKHKTIEVNNTLELFVYQKVFNPDSVKIHGILKTGHVQKHTEMEAIESFLNYIQNTILIAHHSAFDYGMINQMLSRNGLGTLKNECIDTGVLFAKSKHIIYRDTLKKHYTLDDLCTELNVPIVDRHTATGDALLTAMVYLKIIARLDKRQNLNWSYLLNT